ncbi:dUTP diphosphatase [Aerococcaceae bacterium DSM 111020]|nr:dUTP diphosphatase [Aerococcaceae bacterium DSM 111020]
MKENKTRGFEVIKEYADQSISLPHRSTYYAAGYDIESAEDIILPSYWKMLVKYILKQLGQWIHKPTEEETLLEAEQILKPTLVPTGLKAYMLDDEYLQIVNRSSNPLKRRIVLPNSLGIIDKDYYNNSNNEGHIYVQLQNYGVQDVTIRKGDRIAQGIFMKYLLTDDDVGGLNERTGGFGSSD